MIRALTLSALLVALTGCSENKPAESKPADAVPVAAKADSAKAEHKADHGHDHDKAQDHDHDAPASQPATKVPGESPDTRDHKDADGVVRRGEKLTDAATLSVDDCLTKATSLNGKMVKVEGTIDQVCAKKGCWFALRPDGEAHKGKTIRITSKGYRFFMPKDSVGQRATLEGELEMKTVSVEEAQHLEEDRVKATGETPKKITEPVEEVRIAAVAVQMGAAAKAAN
jgi:hypothetical protein